MRAGRGDRAVGFDHHEDTDVFFLLIKGRLVIIEIQAQETTQLVLGDLC